MVSSTAMAVVNGVAHPLPTDPRRTLLDWLRDDLELTGTKKGCDHGQCGACTVIVEGRRINSCLSLAVMHDGDEITTIEGVAGDAADAIRKAWVANDVPQCGYCQPGFMMATAELLQRIPNPTDTDIDDNITNICRCGTYYRMRKAIHKAAQLNQKS